MLQCIDVSIHAPARGATAAHGAMQHALACFNPRARAGRDAIWRALQLAVCMFQSTRPRGARRDHVPTVTWPIDVSIHAPARGATDQSHDVMRRYADVSIHAPARGATVASAVSMASMRCFNPRARAGRDRLDVPGSAAGTVFQSTRPRGARPHDDAAHAIVLMFQSTRPRGARHDRLRHVTQSCVSIHAPARGATSSHG